MALGVLAWKWAERELAANATVQNPVHPALLETFPTFQELAGDLSFNLFCLSFLLLPAHFLSDFVNTHGPEKKPSVVVVGALGRVGSGAVKMAQMLGIEPTQWDLKETQGKSMFW
jgi:hypothetical protein